MAFLCIFSSFSLSFSFKFKSRGAAYVSDDLRMDLYRFNRVCWFNFVLRLDIY